MADYWETVEEGWKRDMVGEPIPSTSVPQPTDHTLALISGCHDTVVHMAAGLQRAYTLGQQGKQMSAQIPQVSAGVKNICGRC